MIFALISLAFQLVQPTDYRSDFDDLVGDLTIYSGYVKSDGIDLKRLSARYRPKFESVADKDKLLSLFESFVGELHDFHASLGTNNQASPRLVPSGTDVVGRWKGSAAFIDQVRDHSLAEKAGLSAGDEIVQIEHKAPRQLARDWLNTDQNGKRAWDWALNSTLAGRWNQPRSITFKHNGLTKTVELPTAAVNKSHRPLTVERRSAGILYLRPEDSLGNNDLIKEFDSVVPSLRTAKGIVLDLRNTPSGGNSAVARGIMGLFISRPLPYQRHRFEERDTGTVREWVEYASPRLAKAIAGKLVVLVGRWTGSMGEGIAIGFDGMKRGTVVGTRMAGLRGAVDGFDLKKSGYRVFFPTEQVFHINGTPRHEWLPRELVNPATKDAWWRRAVRVLNR